MRPSRKGRHISTTWRADRGGGIAVSASRVNSLIASASVVSLRSARCS